MPGEEDDAAPRTDVAELRLLDEAPTDKTLLDWLGATNEEDPETMVRPLLDELLPDRLEAAEDEEAETPVGPPLVKILPDTLEPDVEDAPTPETDVDGATARVDVYVSKLPGRLEAV